MTARLLALLLVCASLAACAGADEDDPSASGADAGAESADAGEAAAEEAGVRVRVVLTGGPHAGTHEATPPGSTCIDYQSTGIDGLGVAHYAGPVESGIASIDFGTKTKVPTSGSIDRFGFTVGIGDGTSDPLKAMGVSYVVRPERGQGTGMATVTGSAPRYTVRVTGTTAQGVGVDATLECLR